MFNDSRQLERLRQIAEPLCVAHGVQLYDIRFVSANGTVLSVLIEGERADDTAGASLQQCQGVSRDLSTALDVHDDLLPSGAYRLEVGSPGLDRPLFRLGDFERFIGSGVKIQTQHAVGGRRRFSGALLGVSGDSVRVEQDGQEVSIPHQDIGKANLVYQF